MISFVGSKGSLKLLVDGNSAVVVDTSVNMIVGSGDADVVFSTYDWEEPSGSLDTSVLELASSALTTLDINVITASGRMYTIPDGVKSEAKKALEWRKEEKRGGTPVGLNTARTLAKGGQIGIEKIRHIAKYFPRHEVDKKGKGWEPGEDNFPSNGRIAWALWGGDAAWRWARAIVERENKKAVTAGGYALPNYLENSDAYKTEYSYTPDVNAFKDAYELDEHSGPEFLVRVRLDGSGFDRLYKVETDGSVYVWDDMGWDNLGHVNGDIWSYDNELDDDYDDCPKDHVLIDPNSAVIISALLQEDPYRKISLEDIDPEEAELVSYGIAGEDWAMADYAMTAAGEGASEKNIKPAAVNQDGNYTPEERSALAKNQTRDATGKFAAAGSRVVVGNDGTNGRGLITGLDKASGAATVQLDNGNTVTVPAKLTAPEESFNQPAAASPTAPGKPLDVDGILGEPKSPVDRPNVQLPGTLPPMSSSDLQSVVNDWAGYVANQRASFKPLDTEAASAPKMEATVKDGKITTQKITPRAADKANEGKPVINRAAQNAKIEARRDKATAGRAPAAPAPKPASNIGPGKIPAAPTPKPVVPAAEARKDKAAAGRAPVVTSEQRRDKATASRAPAPKTGNDVSSNFLLPKPAVKNPAANLLPKTAKGPTSPGSSATSPDAAERRQQDKDKVVSANRESLRQARNADRKAEGTSKTGNFDDKGRYVIQKGDSLWSIADKNKPAGKSTAEYWNEVMKANPKDKFKSGNPSLIYSGEKVNLPGVTGRPATPKKPNNQETLRNVKNAERKADTAKAAASAKAKADAIKSEARRDKATAGRAPAPSTEARRDSATAGRAPASKPKPGTQGPSPRAADKANEGKTVINTGAQTAKTEAKRDKTSAGRAPAPAPKPAIPKAEARRDKAAAGRAPVVTSEDKKDKAAAGRAPAPKTDTKNIYGFSSKSRGSAGTRKRK